MTETKMTKKDYFNELLNIPEVANNEELKAFVEHELELLNNRKRSPKKPSAKQKENEKLIEEIYEQMEEEKAYTNGEMLRELPACAGISGQKLNSLLTKMQASNKVIREERKRVAYFLKVVD